MFIPGIVISVLTFPGVIVHELGHKYFCDRFNVKVHDVKYFRFGNPAGYVLHDIPDKFYKTFFIDIGPFIVNSAVAGTIFALIALLGHLVKVDSGPIVWLTSFFSWIGFSIAMNAFPSHHDAKILWKESIRYLSQGNFIAIVGFPFALLIWIANILSVIWFDLIYAIGLMFAVSFVVSSVFKAIGG